MVGYEPFIGFVFRDAKVVIQRAFHAGEVFVSHHGGQDVAAGRQFNAEALLQIHIGDFWKRRGAARPAHRDVFLAWLIFELVNDALKAGGEVGRAHGQILFMHDLGLLGEFLGGLHTIAAKGVVIGQKRDHIARLIQRGGVGGGVGGGVLAAVAAGAEDVAVPFVAGDAIGHGGLNQQQLFVFLSHRQHGQRHGTAGGAHREIHFVVCIGGGQGSLAHVGLALVVFLNHHNLAARHLHGATGRIFQAHLETHDGLLGIRLQRTGFAGEQSNFHIWLGLRLRTQSQHRSHHTGSQRNHRTTQHLVSFCIQTTRSTQNSARCVPGGFWG